MALRQWLNMLYTESCGDGNVLAASRRVNNKYLYSLRPGSLTLQTITSLLLTSVGKSIGPDSKDAVMRGILMLYVSELYPGRMKVGS